LSPRHKQELFLFSKTYRLAALLFNGYWGSFPRVKQLRCGGDHSPPGHAEVKSECSYICTSPVSLHGMDRDNFTFIVKLLFLGENGAKQSFN
jgi:hypothetical protein